MGLCPDPEVVLLFFFFFVGQLGGRGFKAFCSSGPINEKPGRNHSKIQNTTLRHVL